MGLAGAIMVAALSGSILSTRAVEYFPGGYFHSRVRERLQRQVMASWPGPTELMTMWREGDLSEEERVALLLGGAIYHEPAMLPAYREALQSKSQRLRQAAIYGYRDLLADQLPDVSVTISDAVAEQIAQEISRMQQTLGRQPLITMWLQSALVQEGASLPGYSGIKLSRSPPVCFRAVERLVDVHDLELLVTAFELSSDIGNQMPLVQLIEAVTLSRFIKMPTGERDGWGSHVFESAVASLHASIHRWRNKDCAVDGEEVLRMNLRSLGLVGNIDPLGSEAFEIWRRVLQGSNSRWWMLAARRIYACGGPWYELAVMRSDSEHNRATLRKLTHWYEGR